MTPPRDEKFNYTLAREHLLELFDIAEKYHQDGATVPVSSTVQTAADTLFSSSTQSYREALLGCALARVMDDALNIRLPYVSHGSDAFNGRTLDEQVINPFLHDRLIPSSKGPYLATFRRSVKFIPETASGLRDKKGYEAFLSYIDALETAGSEEELRTLVVYLLQRFLVLRDAATIPLARISRLSLDQYEFLIDRLLQTPSGGLLPVLLAVAMFKTLKECFNLPWEIDWQDINVADRASGVGGDITVKVDTRIFLAVEVTERPIDKSRVVSTFNTKIAPHGIEDYLFFSTDTVPGKETKDAAVQYFAQGHDVNFLQVKPWLINILGTIGSRYRNHFTSEFITMLDSITVPSALKVTWNDLVKKLVTI